MRLAQDASGTLKTERKQQLPQHSIRHDLVRAPKGDTNHAAERIDGTSEAECLEIELQKPSAGAEPSSAAAAEPSSAAAEP